MTEECMVSCEVHLEDVAAARAASPMLADLEAVLPDIALQFENLAKVTGRS